MREAWVVDLGTVAYAESLALQRQLVSLRHAGAIPDVLLLCQHPAVVTIGRSGKREHIGAEVWRRRVPVYEVERGGDVTYHGPGQLVAYPLLALEGPERDLHAYLRHLEEVALRTLASFGIRGERVPGLTGVWCGKNKVCAIGVAVRHWVTLHGFALNVCPDLAPFRWIVACGIPDRGVTSMEQELGRRPEFALVQAEAIRNFGAVFSRRVRPARLADLFHGRHPLAPDSGEPPHRREEWQADGDDGDLRAPGRNWER